MHKWTPYPGSGATKALGPVPTWGGVGGGWQGAGVLDNTKIAAAVMLAWQPVTSPAAQVQLCHCHPGCTTAQLHFSNHSCLRSSQTVRFHSISYLCDTNANKNRH